MEKSLAYHLAAKAGVADLVDILSEKLSASELNSLLLDVFQRRAGSITPAELLRQYRQNRFVQPSPLDPVAFGKFELELLQLAASLGFDPIELSPLSPLGACSVVGPTSQHKIVSALRGTEITADATNVLALESVRRRAEQGFPAEPLCFCTTHRHVRAQSLTMPWHTAHFKVFCLTSAGRDTGDFRFENAQIREHWGFYRALLQEKLGFPVHLRLKSLAADAPQRGFVERLAADLQAQGWSLDLMVLRPDEQPYYRLLQAKIIIQASGQEIEIADSGFTDWTQALAGNRKERFLISGMGSEVLFKLGRASLPA